MIFLVPIFIRIPKNFLLLHHFLLQWNQVILNRFSSKSFEQSQLLVFLYTSILETTSAFDLKQFIIWGENYCLLSQWGYKYVCWHHLSLDCLLSQHHQLHNSSWAELKVKAPNSIGFSNVLCWVLYKLVNIRVSMQIPAQRNNRNITGTIDNVHCFTILPDIAVD